MCRSTPPWPARISTPPEPGTTETSTRAAGRSPRHRTQRPRPGPVTRRVDHQDLACEQGQRSLSLVVTAVKVCERGIRGLRGVVPGACGEVTVELSGF